MITTKFLIKIWPGAVLSYVSQSHRIAPEFLIKISQYLKGPFYCPPFRPGGITTSGFLRATYQLPIMKWSPPLWVPLNRRGSQEHCREPNWDPTRHTLTHWGWVTHICISKVTIGSDNGLSPGRRQAIIWTNAGVLLVVPLGTNFSEILIKIDIFSFKKMHLKISSGKWQPYF